MNIDIKDKKIQEIVNSQIEYIRNMAIMSDDDIKLLLTERLINHPHLIDNYEREEQRKMMYDIEKASKNINSEPTKIARKVA